MFNAINLTTNAKKAPDHAQKFFTLTERCYYENLSLYCANNAIPLENVTDEEFTATSTAIKDYVKGSVNTHDYVYFWLDSTLTI